MAFLWKVPWCGPSFINDSGVGFVSVDDHVAGNAFTLLTFRLPPIRGFLVMDR
jgi:hypothetical protein